MTRSPPVHYEFDSVAVEDGDAFGRYRALYAGGSDVHQTGPGFHARLEACRLGPLVLFDRRLNDVAHERTAARVRGDGFSHFTLQLVVSGRMVVEHDDQAEEAGPGSIALFDLTRPQRTTAFDVRLLTFSVPRDLVERSSVQVAGLHGRILSSAQSGLLADVMTSIVTRQLSAANTEPAPVVGILEGALALALRSEDTALLRDRSAAAVLDRIRLVVEANLSRRDLSPIMISTLAGVSRTVLYELFKPFGGIARYIVKRRAVRLHSLMQRPDLVSLSVGQLALQAGFSSDSHANRSFAEAYGTTPGRFRAVNSNGTGTGEAVLDEATSRPLFDDWLRALS